MVCALTERWTQWVCKTIKLAKTQQQQRSVTKQKQDGEGERFINCNAQDIDCSCFQADLSDGFAGYSFVFSVDSAASAALAFEAAASNELFLSDGSPSDEADTLERMAFSMVIVRATPRARLASIIMFFLARSLP
eukprot:m.357413 g.357413  ORF g.357413 m.357413 type:complete len:135 (+) comp17822_c0_seq1:1854-2258(+)